MKAEQLKKLLIEKYPGPEWALIFELSKGVGWIGQEGRIDVAAFNCWPSKGHHRLAFEIKVSRSDFQRELQQPKKRMWVEENFDETYFVVPHNLIKEHEVPETWGILMATKKGDKLIRRKMATPRDTPELPEGLALSAIRQLSAQMLNAERNHYYFEGVAILTQEMIDKKVARQLKEAFEHERDALHNMQNTVLEMQRESNDYVAELQAPLKKLAELINEWYHTRFRRPLKRHQRHLVEITEEDVVQWAEDLKMHAIKSVLVDAKKARDGLDSLLKAAEEEGLKPKTEG